MYRLIQRRKAILFCAVISFSVFALLIAFAVFAENKSETIKTGGQACIVKKGLIILVEFPDIKHNVERSFVQDRFFKLNNYVQEMSYGKVCIGGDVTEKWYEMPHPISHYSISPRNLEVDKSRVRNLILDAINKADKDVDFSRYSFIVLFLGAKREKYGMMGLCGYPGMLGWSSDVKDILKTKGGQTINGGVAIYSYQAHLGTLFHDIAHILGGINEEGKRRVPCLYDHDLQSKPGPIREVFEESMINMGYWDPLSCHFYKRNIPPPGLSSWTKIRLGWIDESKIKVVKPGETKEIILSPLNDGSSEVLAIKIPVSDTTYYLIENRQPIGSFDPYLPGKGVLIMYGDDSIAECRHGKSPVKMINADPSVPRLEGAAFDIGKKDSLIDRENKLKIQVMEKIGNSYRIFIGPYEK